MALSLSLAKTATKVALCGGALYFTLDMGVWSTAKYDPRAVDKVRTSVLPKTAEYLNKVPSEDELKNNVKSVWNLGVQKTFGGLAIAPEYIGETTTKALDEVKKSLH